MAGKLYQRKEWKEFAESIIELDAGCCQICNRSRENGIILQVHHKIYHLGLMPWEYDPKDCQTLCQYHHAEIHGKVIPDTGWNFLGSDDLGDLIGECEACGNALRYLYYISHPKWESLAVGTDCCDRMTGTRTASELRKKNDRKERFIHSPKWRCDANRDLWTINSMKMEFAIGYETDSQLYYIQFLEQKGNKRFASLNLAKEKVHELIDSGDAARFSRKINTNDQTPAQRPSSILKSSIGSPNMEPPFQQSLIITIPSAFVSWDDYDIELNLNGNIIERPDLDCRQLLKLTDCRCRRTNSRTTGGEAGFFYYFELVGGSMHGGTFEVLFSGEEFQFLAWHVQGDLFETFEGTQYQYDISKSQLSCAPTQLQGFERKGRGR